MKPSHLIGRLIATLVSLFFLGFVISNLIDGGSPTVQGTVLMILVLCLIVSTIISWLRDELGALLLLIFGIIFFLFSLLISDIFIAIITGGPYVLSAVLLGLFKKEVRDVIIPPKQDIISQE